MKINRKSFLAAALVGLVAGCISYHTPPMDRRVTVAPDLGAAVWVTDVRLAKGPSSHFTLQANVVNNTSGVVRMEYRVDWLDATGSAIPSVVSTWQPMSAAAREVVPLQATAPSPEAVDFRFYVQAERR
jgi:uncharacterized protein YcfL